MTPEGLGVEYKLVRSRRRTAALIIAVDSTLTVRAPLQMPLSRIENLIREKRRWIDRKILEQKARPSAAVKQFAEGELFLYLGASCPLRICDDMKGSLYFDGSFCLSARETHRARELFVWWYKREARRLITERVEFFAGKDGFRYRSLRITSARRRWGSCTTHGHLSFSWRLVMAPLDVIDYVVVHELSHLDHCDHSPRFWARVRGLYPEADHCRAWLKKNGPALDLI